MHTVEDALEIVLKDIQPLNHETVDLMAAVRRVLAVDVTASDDLPPFDNSAMDGYAVKAEDVAGASREKPIVLTVVEDIPAGTAPQQKLQNGQAARIMTGAPMPQGADTIVPVEQTDDTRRRPDAPSHIAIYQASTAGDYVRPVGEDVQRGQVVLQQGRRLRPADLGVLAGLGYATVNVVRRPRVAIISTGDELLMPNQPLAPGKIRDSNSYTLAALTQEYGGDPIRLGITRDSEQAVEAQLNAALQHNADLILSSAGVSVGAFDVVKLVLEKMGAINFWKVNMRPGKPLTFGHVQGVPFLGLPGNPVSSMVSFEVFARPVIRKMLGQDWALDTQTVLVGEELTSDGRMTFVRVNIIREDGERVAYSTGTQSSGAISSMVKADGLLIIPAGVTIVQKGERLAFRPFAFAAE
jgi:molybdopterin molybdotransferase